MVIWISTISMDYMDLYALDLFLYQELDFDRATLVLRYKGLSCFSGFSAIFPAFRLFSGYMLSMILMVLMVSETLELLNVSNNRSSYSLAIVHVKL